MPTLDWLNRAAAFTTAAKVPYRLLEQVPAHTPHTENAIIFIASQAISTTIISQNSTQSGLNFTPDRPELVEGSKASTGSVRTVEDVARTPKGAAYYLLYNGILGDKRPASGNVLTREVLAALLDLHAKVLTDAPEGAGLDLMVYGEACRLGEERLKQAKVTFKHIPYDVRAR